MKRSHYVAHTVLVLLIVVILFPIFWVVMTSLRRDNAAFSPKLFSSTLTLQHYKDLLFPPRNVPALVPELMNALGLYPPFDKASPERVEKVIQKDISSLDRLLSESKRIQVETSKIFGRVQSELEEEFADLMRNISKNLRGVSEIFDEFSSDLRDGSATRAAIYMLLKEYKRAGTWYKDITKASEEEMERDYRALIGNVKEKYGETLKEMESLQGEIKRLEDTLTSLSISIAEEEKALEAMSSDLEDAVRVIKLASELHGKNEVSGHDIATDLEELRNISSSYPELKELTRILKDASEILRKRYTVSDEALDVINTKMGFIRSMVEDMKFQLERLSGDMRNMIKAQKELSKAKIKLKKLEERSVALSKELNEAESGLKDVFRKAFAHYLSWQLEEKASAVEKLRKPSTSLTKLSIYFKLLRKNLSIARQLGIRDIKDFEKAVEQLEWAGVYKSMSRAVRDFNSASDKLLREFQERVESFKGKWRKLFDISKSGESISSSELAEMQEIVSSYYEGAVSAPLGIAMRSARRLMDIFPIKEMRKSFKAIDGSLYAYQQIWKRKPKHYFLRWVMNSVIVAGLVAIITTAVTAIAAYPFSRMKFFGRKCGIMVLLLIQMFPAIMYMVALYGMLAFLGKIVPWLGLDTLGGLIFVYLGGIAFNMFLIKGYYDTIPSSLEESAMIDGATRFQTFWLIIVPLARPILAVVVILTFMGTFNEFVLARIVLQDVKNYTYALGLWSFSVGPYETEWGLFTAAALLGMLPMVILFLSLQRFLISGLTKGSVKG